MNNLSENEYEKDFLVNLHTEKIRSQEERAKYNAHKITFIIGFISLGSFQIANVLNLNWLLYLVPVIAICFDLYIDAANSSIKKMGLFLRRNSKSTLEKKWEMFSSENRNYLAPISNFIITIVSTLISFYGIYASKKYQLGIWVLWYIIVFLIEIILWIIHINSIKKMG